MIEVQKGIEPDGLKELREDPMVSGLSPKEAFKMLRNPLKAQVTECLKRDQGQLCVYCMSRIPRDDKDAGIPGTTIEHFIPIDPVDGRDVGQGLDYQNLFAVCHGNTRKHEKGMRRTTSKDTLTCDKHRLNTEFRKISPCRKDTLQSIFYTLDGRIGASDPDVEFDLVDTLNLNCTSAPLIAERKAALDVLLEDIGNVEEGDLHNYCADMLEEFHNERDPKTPYAGILIWYLQTMVNALACSET